MSVDNPIEHYANQVYCQILNRRLAHLEPVHVQVDLSAYIEDVAGLLGFHVRPYAFPIGRISEDPTDPCTAIVFDAKANGISKRAFLGLVHTEPLTKDALSVLNRHYEEQYGRPPETLDDALNHYETYDELFRDLIGWHFHLELRPQEGRLALKYVYSGAFQGQGLMTGLMERIRTVVNPQTIDTLTIPNVVEASTARAVNPLRRKITDDAYLCSQLARKYVKSPFLKMLDRLGYKDISLSFDDDELRDISARQAETVRFSVEEFQPESIASLEIFSAR